MSLPFNLPGPTAQRQPFVDFNTDFAVHPTVGMNQDDDLNVYVCDDQEELRRLGPRQPRVGPQQPALSGREVGDLDINDERDDTARRPLLTGGEGLFASMFADGTTTGTERTQVSGSDQPASGGGRDGGGFASSPGAGGNRAAKAAPGSTQRKGAWGNITFPEAHVMKTG